MTRGLPRGHAAAARARRSVYNHVDVAALPAHDLQGGAAGRRSASRAWRGLAAGAPGRGCARCGAPRVPAAALVAAPLARADRALAAAAAGAARSTSSCPGSASRPRWTQAAPTSTASLPRQHAGARAARPGRSRSTRGAARSTRSCRALTDRPVAVRYETPYADLHAVDLLWTIDALVQQRRLVPGPAAPAAAPDRRRARSSPAPTTTPTARARRPAAAAARELARPPGPASATRGRRALGPRTLRSPLRPARRAAGSSASTRAARPTGLDGDAAGSPGLAAFGALPAHGRRATPPTMAPARSALRPPPERGDQRLQPPPVPARVRRCRTTGAALTADDPIVGRRRAARPVRGPRHRRADRAGPARRALPAGADRRPARRSSPSTGRSRRSTAIRTPLAGRPRPRPRAAGSRSASTRRATCPTSTCSPTATRAAAQRVSRVAGHRFRCIRAGTASGSTCRRELAAPSASPGRRAHTAARRRLPRDPHPGVHVTEALRAAGARGAARSPGRDSRHAAHLRLPAHDRRRPVRARLGARSGADGQGLREG